MEIAALNTVGILGGMSSAATREYYQLINQYVQEAIGGHDIAELLIASVNFGNIARMVNGGAWELAGEYLAEKALSLEKAGVSCIFMATNTMHKVREAIKARISIPFIDIFETVGAEMNRAGIQTAGLLGTNTVMSDPFYRETFRQMGIELVVPSEADKREVNRIIWDEMTKMQFLPPARVFFVETMEKLRQAGAEGLILGCTEIKMLVQPSDFPALPFFDTTTLHCQLAAQVCLGKVDPKELTAS